MVRGPSDFFLADDLSGALDAAAAFAAAGRGVRIALEPGGDAGDAVLALSTETRNAAAPDAANTVRRTLEAMVAGGGRLLYKKIDSTLRGPVAAELRVVLEMMPDTDVLFAPANPRAGRTVRAGILRVNGVPVAETEFGRDPASPLRTSRVREVLGDVATSRVSIPDIEVEADFVRAIEFMERSGRRWIGVGSGGLVKAIAVRSGPLVRAALPPGAVPRTPVLMLGGSAHPLNRQQAAVLAHRAGLPVRELSMPAGGTVLPGARRDLETGGLALVQLPAARVDRLVALQAIVDAAVHLIRAAGVRRVFATGGETAFALCQRLGIGALKYVAEIEPGLALALGESSEGAMLFAIKPGGFGDEQTWVRAYERLVSEQ